MVLSCDCNYIYEDYVWYTEGPSNFHQFNMNGEYKRRKRCCSCHKLIDFGAECIHFDRTRRARGEYEENRFGDEVSMSPIFMCEKCAETYINLYDLGYQCMNPAVDVQEHLEEYWDMTGFNPDKYK